MSLGSVIGEILDIVRRHGLRVPRDLSVLLTMLMIADGVVAELDPEFRLAEALAPYAGRHLISGMTPDRIMQRLEAFGVNLVELAADLPPRLDHISEAIESGGLEVHLRPGETDALLARAERLANRVALRVLAAALIDGFVQMTTHRRRRVSRLRKQGRTARASRRP